MSALDLYAFRQEHGGVVFEGGRRGLFPGPGHSRRDRSLSVRLKDDGSVLVFSFANDPFPVCADYLGLSQDRVERPDWAERKRLRDEREVEQRRRRNEVWAFCETVWAGTFVAEDSLVEAYLTGRGLAWPYSADLRFHPAAPLDYERKRVAPAMVALVRAADGQPSGLHVTALSPDGRSKAPMLNARRMFGACRGASVQLCSPELGELAVAEGIETALSFARIKGAPTWAALSTAGVTAFEVPTGVTLLNVAPDGDKAGREAAVQLAERASKRCDVTVVDPGDGLDWNDLLMRGDHG